MSLHLYHFLEKKKVIERMLPISLVMLFMTFGEGIIAPIFSIFINSITNDLFQTGMILSIIGIVGIITSIPFGVITDKYNLKRIIQWTLFAGVLSPLFYLMAYDFNTLFLARVYFSVVNSMLWCVLWTYTFRIVDDEEKASEMSIPILFMHTGAALSPVIGGLIAIISFALPFYVLSGSFFGAFILATFILPKTDTEKNVNSFGYVIKKDFKFLFEILKKYKVTIAMIVLTYAIFSSISGFLPILLEQEGFNYTMIGFILFIAFLPILFFDVPIGEYIDKIGKKRAIIITLLMMGLVSFVFSFSFNFYLVVMTMIFFALATAIALINISAMTSDLSSHEDRGLLSGVRKFLIAIGITIGPIFSGALFNLIGVVFTLQIVGFISIASATLYLFFKGEYI